MPLDETLWEHHNMPKVSERLTADYNHIPNSRFVKLNHANWKKRKKKKQLRYLWHHKHICASQRLAHCQCSGKWQICSIGAMRDKYDLDPFIETSCSEDRKKGSMKLVAPNRLERWKMTKYGAWHHFLITNHLLVFSAIKSTFQKKKLF
jgi:hypothetical protein